MKLDISSEEFSSYSTEKKKKYIASLLIKESGARSIPQNMTPIAFIMAGLPGAGKTEFLDTLDELLANNNRFEQFVRIDLDQIVTVYPDYTAKDYYKFRKDGNLVLSRCVDAARRGRYNMMIDGTFSGKSGASIETVNKLLQDNYVVVLFYMYDEARTAWEYTKKREKETMRGVDKDGFLAACDNIRKNLHTVAKLHADKSSFTIMAVVQKELRDREYTIKTEKDEVDKIIAKPYNINGI